MKKTCLVLVLALAAASLARATDYTKSDVATADWNAAVWSPVPGTWTDADRAFITGGGVNWTPGSHADSTTLNKMEVKASSGGTTLNLTSYLRTWTGLIMNWNNTGTVTINHSAGEYRLVGNAIYDATIGYKGADNTAIYNLTGSGVVKSPGNLYIGRESDAIMNIDGGELNIWGSVKRIYIGQTNCVGTVNLSAGLLKRTDGRLYVGNYGTGILNQTGGVVWLAGGGDLYIGGKVGGNGSYTISGGSITNDSGWSTVGHGSTFTVDGSVATFIELNDLNIENASTFAINLDAGGSTLVKASVGVDFNGDGTLELDTMPGFNGTLGSTYDLFWTPGGAINTNGMSFVNLSGVDFELRIIRKDGGDVLQAVIPSLDYAAWTTEWGGLNIGSETNDYDNDGLSNLYEFGLNGDPTNSADQGTAPTFEVVDSGGSNVFNYVHPQRSDPGSGLAYSLALTTNLVSGSWETTGYEITGTNVTGGLLDFVTNTTSMVENKKFIRLNIGNPNFTLWQLPSQSGTQMMSYVIESEGGKVVVIDGGWEEDSIYLRSFLASRGYHVDAWFITHPHADHIEALTWILLNPGGTVIDHIYASFPPMEWYQEHAPGTAITLSAFTNALASVGKDYTDVDPGDIFNIDEIHIEILATENPEIIASAVNNSSMVMKVSDPQKSILFLGDTESEAGNKILGAVDHEKLKADYVQASHHGNWGVDFSFYDVVLPEYCLWPTPLWLWNNDNGGGYDSGPWTTLDTRQWMDDLYVKSNYVSGVSGLIEIK